MTASLPMPTGIEELGWALVHFVWQGAAIGAVAAFGSIVLRKSSARLRYLFFCGTLAACGFAPCLTWWAIHPDASPFPVAKISHVEESIVSPSRILSPLVPVDGTESVSQAVLRASSHLNLGRFPRAIELALPGLMAFWMIGVVVLSLRLFHDGMQLRSLCRSGIPVQDAEWTRRLQALAERIGIDRALLFLESARVEIPTVMGWLTPVLLVPATFLTALPADQVEAILAHELAHIRRHDYLVNLFQIAIETLLFYHPAVWWISRAIRQERENCCDDLALQIVGDKRTYAAALAALEVSRSLPMVITLAATGGSLVQRIRRLVGAEDSDRAGRRWTAFGAAFLVLLFIAVSAAIVLPVWKAHAAPQLLFVIDKKAIHLSPRAEAKIIGEIEAAIRAVNSDSDNEPAKFKGSFYAFTPKRIEEDGCYLRIIYPQFKTFAALNGFIQAREIYITDNPYANLFGFPPGGIILVSDDGRVTQVSLGSNTPLLNLTFNTDIHAHLPEQQRDQVDRVLSGHLNMAKTDDLEPELRLVVAANAGDLPEIKKLLTQGIRLDQIPASKTTLLFAAGSPEVAEFLIAHGIKVDVRNADGDTALISICKNDSSRREQERIAPTARVLLKHGADPNAHDSAGWTSLIVAPDGATVDALVAYGADVHARFNGLGVLDQLDINNYRELSAYQALAAHGLAIDNHENGVHLLNHAAYLEQADIVQWLLDRGVDPNGTDPRDGSYDGFVTKPLIEAARMDSPAVARLLIEHGAKVDAAVVDCALENQRTQVFKVFWESGARNFSELLYDVSQKAPVGKIESLLKKGMPADPPQDNYMTPLALAAELGELDAVQVLLRYGANPNRKMAKGSLLAFAAAAGHDDVVQALLQRGAHPDLDTMNAAINGSLVWTQFYHRTSNSPTIQTFYKIIRQLIDAGGYKNVPSDQAAAALLGAPDQLNGWYEDLVIKKMQLAAGLDPTSKNAQGKSAIDIVQARYAKVRDAQTRAQLLDLINLLKSAKTANR
jgi:beta-lactamase regulating signal transducer with metallopeptidase domain/ankyrin repeat protein